MISKEKQLSFSKIIEQKQQQQLKLCMSETSLICKKLLFKIFRLVLLTKYINEISLETIIKAVPIAHLMRLVPFQFQAKAISINGQV